MHKPWGVLYMPSWYFIYLCILCFFCVNYTSDSICTIINTIYIYIYPKLLQMYTTKSAKIPWWRHQMETFSALLVLCAGKSPVPGEFPAQRPVTRSFDVFFDLRLNKRLSKQSWGWWFETLSHPLWRHCNASFFLWRRPGDKPLFEPMMASLPTHICVTRPH